MKKIDKKLFLKKTCQYIGIAIVYIGILWTFNYIYLPWATGSNELADRLKEISRRKVLSVILSGDTLRQEKECECSNNILVEALCDKLSKSQPYVPNHDLPGQSGYITLVFENQASRTLSWYIESRYPNKTILRLCEMSEDGMVTRMKSAYPGHAVVEGLYFLVYDIRNDCSDRQNQAKQGKI